MARLAVALVLVLCCVAYVSSASLTVQVEPKEMECFYEQLDRGKTFQMDFEVVRGGLLDVKLIITDPNDQVVIDKLAFFNRPDMALNQAEGKVNFVGSTTGTYKLCFDNRMSRWTAKVVSFEVKAAEVKTVEEPAKLEHLSPVVDSVIKISETLEEIEKIQHHMRVQEQSQRDTSETTNGRVQWMAVMESVLLITLTMVQLNYVRGWFSVSGGPRV